MSIHQGGMWSRLVQARRPFGSRRRIRVRGSCIVTSSGICKVDWQSYLWRIRTTFGPTLTQRKPGKISAQPTTLFHLKCNRLICPMNTSSYVGSRSRSLTADVISHLISSSPISSPLSIAPLPTLAVHLFKCLVATVSWWIDTKDLVRERATGSHFFTETAFLCPVPSVARFLQPFIID
ncbi:hypothetical protein FRC18_004539 [Serendipita sp. 400]|nr:hypothetical protein FRC18_004539 [Serendipita sp. 400]